MPKAFLCGKGVKNPNWSNLRVIDDLSSQLPSLCFYLMGRPFPNVVFGLFLFSK